MSKSKVLDRPDNSDWVWILYLGLIFKILGKMSRMNLGAKGDSNQVTGNKV